MPVAAVDASMHLHENPEGLVGPMWIVFISLFFSLLAWRVSCSKRYAMLAAVGTPVSVLLAAGSIRVFGQ
jgi:hypothetical protein